MEAEGWLRSAVAMQPIFPAAHRLLAAFVGRTRGDYEAAVHHRQLAKEARALLRRSGRRVGPEERQTFERPALRRAGTRSEPTEDPS